MNSEVEEALQKAWLHILQQYTTKIKEDSREVGAGMSLFLMMERNDSPFNCRYIYIEQNGPMWERYLEYSGYGDKIKEKYDSDTMYMVSVHVQDPKDTTQTLGNIRLFLFENDQDVEF